MKLHVDNEADALYLRLDDTRIMESQQVAPGVVLDYNDTGHVVGVEILNLSKRAGKADLQRLIFETTGGGGVTAAGSVEAGGAANAARGPHSASAVREDAPDYNPRAKS